MAGNAAPAPALRTSVDGGDIAFESVGPVASGRSVIVLLHGWALDRRMWGPQLAALSGARRIIAIDRRGFGASTAPCDLSQESGDIAAVLDAAGVEAAIIVGMSQAARVAADFALRRADRCAGIVLQGARLGSIAAASPPDIPITDYVALARGGRLDAMKALWRGHPLMRLADARHQPLVDQMLDGYAGADLRADRAPLADLDDATLAAIDAPALILTGEADTPLRRRIADQLATLLPHAERAEFEGAGHLCNLCAAEAYNRAIARFAERAELKVRARIS